MIADNQGRAFSSLRVSLTKACNLACTYCVPEKFGLDKKDKDLSAEEFFQSIKLLCDLLEIRKIRMTGGEPLISPKLDLLLPKLKTYLDADVTLTTNAQCLDKKLGLLLENGVQRINISLDTLQPKKFKEFTRGGSLKKTINGIETSLEAGLRLKINMIPMRGLNDDEIMDLLDFCLGHNIELRFIELMKMGHLASEKEYKIRFFPKKEILTLIQKKYVVVEGTNNINETATRFKIPGKGTFGIIANDSAPFCNTCDRLRLSSEGMLLGCLSSTKTFSMRDLLQMPEELALAKLRSLLKDALATKQVSSFYGNDLIMKSVGG